MKEDSYISFETAKLAYNKGYRDNFRPYYSHGGNLVLDAFRGSFCAAPMQSMLQRWLRDEHKIHIIIQPLLNWPDIVFIYTIQTGAILLNNELIFTTYEEALEAGLYRALELIP